MNKRLIFFLIYSPCLVSVVHLANFIVFGGFSSVCHSFLQTKSRLDTAVSKDLDLKVVLFKCKLFRSDPHPNFWVSPTGSTITWCVFFLFVTSCNIETIWLIFTFFRCQHQKVKNWLANSRYKIRILLYLLRHVKKSEFASLAINRGAR